MSKIRRNLFYNTLLTSAYYVFPLIVYPYVSRVLGVSNIGLVGFIDSIATYFILFSMMGISIVGTREIARAGADLSTRRNAFASLLSLHSVMTVATLAVMAAATFLVPQLRAQLPMMGVGMCKLVFNLFLIEWFYRGIEDFKFITIRTILVRACYVGAVFIFVRKAEDTFVYYFLTMTVVAVTAAINTAESRRFLGRGKVRISIGKYLKPFFTLGVYELLAASYSTLNAAFLGFVSDDTEVGYYTTAAKVISILTMIYISFSGVLLPRMSSLVAEGNTEIFRKYFRKTFKFVFLFSVPVIAIIEIFAPEVIMLLSGPGYEGAVVPLRIMMPFLLVLGLEQLFTVQTLMPMGRETLIMKITVIAAMAGILLNVILVPRLGAIGSACVWGGAETAILISASFFLRKTLIKLC